MFTPKARFAPVETATFTPKPAADAADLRGRL
jgi:hypothetical protein